jgi:DNA polymerase V
MKAPVQQIPLFISAVKAGFPSPADDYIEQTLDFNELLVRRPAATFSFRVSGDSMTGAGIHHGDILVVDRSVRPSNGQVVIAVIDGELTVKRLDTGSGRPVLRPENSAYPAIEVSPGSSFEIWGTVLYSIHALE